MRLTLTEAYDFGTKERHDPARGIVFGVKVLGLASRNGKEYSRQAIKEAFDRKLYHDKPSYIDHPPGKSNARGLRERFGRLKNLRLDAAGELWCDYHYNPKSSYAEEFAWF